MSHGTDGAHHVANASHGATESAGGGRDKGFASVSVGDGDVFVFNNAFVAGNTGRAPDSSHHTLHHDHALGLHADAPPTGPSFAGMGAHDSGDHIIYNNSTGALSFDSHGTGGAHHIEFTHFPGLFAT